MLKRKWFTSLSLFEQLAILFFVCGVGVLVFALVSWPKPNTNIEQLHAELKADRKATKALTVAKAKKTMLARKIDVAQKEQAFADKLKSVLTLAYGGVHNSSDEAHFNELAGFLPQEMKKGMVKTFKANDINDQLSYGLKENKTTVVSFGEVDTRSLDVPVYADVVYTKTATGNQNGATVTVSRHYVLNYDLAHDKILDVTQSNGVTNSAQ